MFTLLFSLRDCLRSRAVLQAEILALRHHLFIFELSRRGYNLRIRWTDRALWVWLSLRNHTKDLVSIDFFVVPTITFQLLFTFVILSHDRTRLVHFAVTANSTAEWTARQLLQAFPWDHAPRYLLRDRDRAYGLEFSEMAKCMGLHEVLTAPRSPWQNAHLERLIGSIRSRPIQPPERGRVVEIPQVGGL